MSSSVSNGLKILLRPAVRLAVKNGLKIQDVFECLKSVFVSVAQQELSAIGDGESKSRISVITGLQRRDITRLLSDEQGDVKSVNILMKVIGHWSNDKRFRKGNEPKPLSCEGEQSEFFGLIQSVSKDLNPYTILFELERIGAVERKDGALILKARSYQARHDPEHGLILWSNDVQDLVAAVEYNIENKEQIPNLHIATRYDNLVKDELANIRRWVLERGAEFHAQARAYISQFDKDLNPQLFDRPGGGKAVVGSFSLTEDLVNATEK